MANLPTRLNNPGDLKDPSTGQFRQFNSPEEGFQALKADLYGKVTGNTSTGLGPQSTLLDFAKVWAPSSDNNDPSQYATNIASHLKTAPTTPLASLNVDDLASAVANAEGYQGSAPARMTPQQFAKKIKTKYPQYQNLDDTTLTQKVLAKYPIYQHSVDTTGLSIPSPIPSPAQEPGLGAQLENRLQDVSSGVTEAGTGLSKAVSGDVGGGLVSGVEGALQAAGGIAGGIGDISTKALEIIPGVKALESGAGKAINAVLGLPGLKDVVQGISQVAQDHPRLAKDVGAAVNIASVLPLFKGVSLAVEAAKTAGAQALKGTLENAARKEITGVAMSTIPGQKLLERAAARGLDPIETMVKNGAFPEVVTDAAGNTRYDTQNAFHALSTDPEEAQLQTLLSQVDQKAGGVDLRQVKQQAISDIRKEFENDPDYDKAVKETGKLFDSYRKRFGDFIPVTKLNDLKRAVRGRVNFNTDAVLLDSRYQVGQTMMNSIERIADKLGVPEVKDIDQQPGVKDINQQMAAKIEAKKLLKRMKGARVKLSGTEKAARGLGADIAGGLGELVGSATGIPFAGTLAGRAAGKGLLSREPGTVFRMLERARKGGSAGLAGRAIRGVAVPTALRAPGKAQAQ